MIFIFLPENTIFLISFVLILLFGVIELLSFLLGLSLFTHADAALSPHIDTGGSLFSQGLDWLNIGKVPLFILLLLFLSCFSLCGLVIQWLLYSFFGHPLHGGLVSIPAAVVAVVSVKKIGAFIARIIPQHETSAISEDSFIGCMAIITGGVACVGEPAQCRLVDRYHQTHYLLVQPDSDKETFSPGDKIIITGRLSLSLFQGMRNPWPEHL